MLKKIAAALAVGVGTLALLMAPTAVNAKITPVDVACVNPGGQEPGGQQPTCKGKAHEQKTENQNPAGHAPPGHNK